MRSPVLWSWSDQLTSLSARLRALLWYSKRQALLPATWWIKGFSHAARLHNEAQRTDDSSCLHNFIFPYVTPVERNRLINEKSDAQLYFSLLWLWPRSRESTGSNYVIFPSGLATSPGFVHSRFYMNFLPSLRLAFVLYVLEYFRMCHFNSEEQICWATFYEWNNCTSGSFQCFFLLKFHAPILHCHGWHDFVISLFKTKSSQFQLRYNMHFYYLSSLEW